MKDVNAGEKDKYEGKRRYHENTYFSPSIPVYPKDVRVSHTVNTHTESFFQVTRKKSRGRLEENYSDPHNPDSWTSPTRGL